MVLVQDSELNVTGLYVCQPFQVNRDLFRSLHGKMLLKEGILTDDLYLVGQKVLLDKCFEKSGVREAIFNKLSVADVAEAFFTLHLEDLLLADLKHVNK